MIQETTAKYGPALLMAPIGVLDPIYASIAFGMITGWFAIAGVMYDQQKPVKEIRRAMVTSILIGGGGALFAAFAVEELRLTPLGAAIVAFGIAFGGVKSIKLFSGAVMYVIEWIVDNIADDAARIGRKRQEAHKMLIENTQEDRKRMGLPVDERLEHFYADEDPSEEEEKGPK